MLTLRFPPRLAKVVQGVLQNGMDDEELEKLTETRVRPENCPAMQASKVNQEI